MGSLRIELVQWAKKSECKAYQRNMLDCASSFMRISVEEFDAAPYVINCRNGIVDLRTQAAVRFAPQSAQPDTTAVILRGWKCPIG
jgi:phage/plasmid-associated DNA primase